MELDQLAGQQVTITYHDEDKFAIGKKGIVVDETVIDDEIVYDVYIKELKDVVQCVRSYLQIQDQAQIKSAKEHHREIVEEMHDTFVKKNNDYGNSVEETYSKYGVTSLLVRIEDKLNRLRSLTQGSKQQVNDESVEDTVIDAANYLTILAYLIRKHGAR